MAFTFYSSSDAGAPVLSGTAGALTALLAAILVNGYGAKAAAGWTQTYMSASTSERVFRPAHLIDAFVRIIDDATGTGGAREAFGLMYTSQATPPTGANVAPRAAVLPKGIFLRKSLDLTATARTWWAYADAKTIYLNINEGYASAPYTTIYMLGAFTPFLPGDPHPFIISGRFVENAIAGTSANNLNNYFPTATGNTITLYNCLEVNGSGQSATPFLMTNQLITGVDGLAVFGTIGPARPTPGGALTLIEPFIFSGMGEPRGRLRGYWIPMHNNGFTLWDTFSINIDGVARSMIVVPVGIGGQILIETSDTLDT